MRNASVSDASPPGTSQPALSIVITPPPASAASTNKISANARNNRFQVNAMTQQLPQPQPRTLIIRGDARSLPLPDGCVDLVVTSPPYFGLRSYTDGGEHYEGQIGSEATPAEWLAAMVECTREMVRVLKPEGSIFINLGDKYAGAQNQRSRHQTRPLGGGRGHLDGWDRTVPQDLQPGTRDKSLLGLPWRYALACTDQLGLILRRDIIWAKPNGLPESVTDRCRSAHEYVFHLVKQPRYYSAVDEIREEHAEAGLARRAYPFAVNDAQRASKNPVINGAGMRPANPLGKLPGSVWTIPSQPLTVPASVGVDHFAAFPVELPRRIVLGWSPPGVCVACGQGRRPVVHDPSPFGHVGPSVRDIEANGQVSYGATSQMKLSGGPRAKWKAEHPATITGYVCACAQPDAPTRPAIVLDPFAGTGTTLLAAAACGRHAIGVDRSADYTRLATWRVHDPGERAKAAEVPKPPPVIDGQEPLFALP